MFSCKLVLCCGRAHLDPENYYQIADNQSKINADDQVNFLLVTKYINCGRSVTVMPVDLPLFPRHPESSGRPSFEDLVLSLSDGENHDEANLLKWSDEDKAIHPQAATLGADLETAQCLYMDLQMAYISDKT